MRWPRTRDPGGTGGGVLQICPQTFSVSSAALRLGGMVSADCARRWRKGRREGLRPVLGRCERKDSWVPETVCEPHFLLESCGLRRDEVLPPLRPSGRVSQAATEHGAGLTRSRERGM